VVTISSIPRLVGAPMVLVLVACGGGGTNPPPPSSTVPQYAYVVNGMEQTVSQYSITANGTLTPLSPASIATGAGPISVTVDPSHHYVYVSNATDGTTSQYVIQKDGTLSPNSPATVATGESYVVGFNPSGQFAYVVNYSPNTISQFSVGANGVIEALAVTPVVTWGVDSANITFTPNGKYVYVSRPRYSDSAPSEVINQYAVAPDTGALSPLNPLLAPILGNFPSGGPDPYASAVDATSSYAYVTSPENNIVLQFSIGPSGDLVSLSPASVSSDNGPGYILIHPNNKYAYVANYYPSVPVGQPGTITQYNISANGQLTPMATASVPAGLNPSWLASDTSGQFVYAVNNVDNTISEYLVDANGSLTSLGVVSTGNSPLAMATTYVGQ
jgi:6-phosphogluconolactonase